MDAVQTIAGLVQPVRNVLTSIGGGVLPGNESIGDDVDSILGVVETVADGFDTLRVDRVTRV